MIRECGAYADHADHIRPRSWWPGIPPRNGSTSAWRRLRLFVLDRDGWRCRVPVDEAGDRDVVADERLAHGLDDDGLPTGLPLPAHPDDPTNLRAACARHDIGRSNLLRSAPSKRRQPAGTQPWKW